MKTGSKRDDKLNTLSRGDREMKERGDGQLSEDTNETKSDAHNNDHRH